MLDVRWSLVNLFMFFLLLGLKEYPFD